MSSRPVLGIIACNRTVGTEIAQAVMNRYVAHAMRYADAAALLVPSMPELMTASEVAPYGVSTVRRSVASMPSKR